ncbi:hypothetical protein [Effusibacillus lacus]|uniref:Molybdopterin cofactor biosynthesis MoaD-related C-terminal domain-containing protein n=1 Tax=Effusibacillus lacus TaxID=1348429 RepID=A0A292YL56_9BACL|nr:hypothetical protein [Effusibacillus lacus]TCS69423.1 hypothetical protein EDD64_13750 [Effusibacillus lacus]GAX89190.1 hypothetical protein EFBL_0808 [Effusibacillus lacus]
MIRLEFRGLYQSTYKQFLLDLGGRELEITAQGSRQEGSTLIEGEGWTALLEPEDSVSFSKVMKVPRTFITFCGEPEVVDVLVSQFRLKALRGGG